MVDGVEVQALARLLLVAPLYGFLDSVVVVDVVAEVVRSRGWDVDLEGDGLL